MAQESLAFPDAAVQLLHERGALSCSNTKSLPDILRIAGSSIVVVVRSKAINYLHLVAVVLRDADND